VRSRPKWVRGFHGSQFTVHGPNRWTFGDGLHCEEPGPSSFLRPWLNTSSPSSLSFSKTYVESSITAQRSLGSRTQVFRAGKPPPRPELGPKPSDPCFEDFPEELTI